ncbi:MAG: cytochrome P450 [Nocardioides sp.]
MGLHDRTALVRTGHRFSGWLRARTSGPATLLGPLARRPLVVRGQEGVDLFYDTQRVRRRAATPGPIARMLYGQDAVHTLDDAAHRHRKQLFLEVTEPERVADLREVVSGKWARELDRWVRRGTGTVLPAAIAVFGEAVQEWAGAGDAPAVMERRSRDLGLIIDGFATPSPAWLRARRARRRADAWATRLITEVRQGRRRPERHTAVWVMAHATDLDGEVLPARTAAVELLNVLRPTVAVAYFAAFAALELEANPDLADRCATGDPEAVEKFCQEVRRMSPFVPLLAGRSRCPFTWHGHEVDQGDRLFLDVYATDNDPRAWTDATTFDPDRFRSDAAERPDFIPQGGGCVETGHRCPGEGIAMALLRTVVPSLARLDWSIHPDDRIYSLRRVPARPDGGVRLLDVRRHLVLRPV